MFYATTPSTADMGILFNWDTGNSGLVGLAIIGLALCFGVPDSIQARKNVNRHFIANPESMHFVIESMFEYLNSFLLRRAHLLFPIRFENYNLPSWDGWITNTRERVSATSPPLGAATALH